MNAKFWLAETNGGELWVSQDGSPTWYNVTDVQFDCQFSELADADVWGNIRRWADQADTCPGLVVAKMENSQAIVLEPTKLGIAGRNFTHGGK